MKEHIKDNMKLYNRDCMEGMAEYQDNYFDLAIVDPPYGINVNMNAGRKKDTRSSKRTVKKWDNNTPNDDYFMELFRVSKRQIIWCANHMIDKIKINSQGWIFWDKCVAPGCSFSDGELAWTSFNQSLKKSVIPWSGFIGQEGEKFHPTTKPIKLYSWILQNYSSPENKILDTHLGSASHAIAWNYFQKGGEFVGFELDSEYFDKSIKRIEEETAQFRLL